MTPYDRVDCIVGDKFFVDAAAASITHTLLSEHATSTMDVEYVFSDSSVEKLNAALLPSIFDIQPKLVVLKNVANKFIAPAIESLKNTQNVYLLIGVEDEQPDGRVKIFKDLEKNNCLHKIGFAQYKTSNKVLDIAFTKMSTIHGCIIPDNVKNFLAEYVPKATYKDKPIHNLSVIDREIQKALYCSETNTVEYDAVINLIANPRLYNNMFDITSTFADRKLGEAINIIDSCVNDINEARNMINFILSEVKIIAQIAEKSNRHLDALLQQLTHKPSQYTLLEDLKEQEVRPIHPYRLKKILEKSNTKYFKNYEQVLQACITTHNDLNYHYTDNCRIPLIKLAITVCSL